MDIISIARRPDLIPAAAKWFNEKWQIPIEAYVESMNAALADANGVPAWYVILDRDRIIAGLGVIDNDFHKRPDLTPNLCALYVEREYRLRGLARRLLDHACRELGAHGCTDAYLITDHTSLYERCGWSFFTMVEENDGGMIRMYHRAIQRS